MAATLHRVPGSAVLMAALRSAVKVAMPQRRGMLDEVKAMRMARSP
jgi:hypothetical protein